MKSVDSVAEVRVSNEVALSEGGKEERDRREGTKVELLLMRQEHVQSLRSLSSPRNPLRMITFRSKNEGGTHSMSV